MKHFILWAVGCLILSSCASVNTTGQWMEVSSTDGSKPIQRHEAAFVAVGDKFYLLGGRGIRPVSIYDTETEKWTEGTKPPLEIHHFQPVVVDEKIYLVGAMTGPYPNETPVENIIIYDPNQDKWETGPEIPENRRRGGAGAVFHDNKIYVACGIKNGHIGDHKTWIDVYDISTEKWSTLPDAPRPRDHFQAVILKDKLYLLAGRTSMSKKGVFGHTVAEVDVLDLKTNTWSTLEEDLPTTRAGNSAIGLHNHVLVIGGESDRQQKAHNEVEALNVKSGKWESWPTLITGRHGTSVVMFQNKIFLASGCGNRGGSPELRTMESYPLK